MLCAQRKSGKSLFTHILGNFVWKMKITEKILVSPECNGNFAKNQHYCHK